ncbi:hypothetical protein J4558_07775 [Leptolyngbya sp. 15MV]|nr:hypothetical protein J4558_07775 [Leptolyngbya sp. 15MV]
MSLSPLPDSLFTWVFEANTGDRWGGWLVADSVSLAAGDTIAGALGRYVITLEEERGADLSGFGLEDGEVRVEWYFDASAAQFLVTRNGAGFVSGIAGLGSEVDAAWTSQGWVNFGRGGLLQVNVQENMRFAWGFEATSGDRMFGTLSGIAGSLNVGQTIATAHGTYRITSEERHAAGDPDGATPGLVRTTRYFDANTGRDLTLESGGTVPTGQLGLGSELDRVWTGTAWVQVGQGGARQADGQFALYAWRFEATSGDRYSGLIFESATAYQPGDTIAGAQGRYVIESEVPQGTARSFTPGTVWIDTYFDARSGQTMKGYMPHTAFQASLGLGLGNEQDWVWDGKAWDPVGRAGALQSDVETYGFFNWRFEANSGDRYSGFLYGDTLTHTVGQIITGPHGRYVVDSLVFTSPTPAFAQGTIWINEYFDSRSGQTLKANNLHRQGLPSDGNGLGNERDTVFDGTEWVTVGRAGARQIDIIQHGFWTWRFEANSGDRYTGFLYGPTDLYGIGQIVNATAGRYVIEGLSFVSSTRAHPAGTIWINEYFDARFGVSSKATNLHTLGQPSAGLGLGNEQDTVFNGTAFVPVGRAGALQADLPSFGFWTWRFEANSGDRYTGFLYGQTDLYTAGQIVTATAGRYVIESLSFVSQTAAATPGTIWINEYFDARYNATAKAVNLHTLGTASQGSGLGNEVGSILVGGVQVPVGRAGALQADIPSFGFWTWRFEANSGDRYTGFLYADSSLYQPNQIITATAGRYGIEGVSFLSQTPGATLGTVWINTYFDARYGATLKATNLHVLGQPSAGSGLGNEVDSILVNGAQVPIGRAGALQADIPSFGFFGWRFEANSGDRSTGWVYGETLLHQVGQQITTAAGRYVIQDLTFVSQSRAFVDGTVWINEYFDSASGRTAKGYNLHVGGIPSVNLGLGNEVDWVQSGTALVPVGRGGALQVDLVW